jgi:hypothetical protein
MKETYAALIHSRWLESEIPRATIIRSTDGFIWHDVCVCNPDYAEEIVAALNTSRQLRDFIAIGDELVDAIRSNDLQESHITAWENYHKNWEDYYKKSF